MAASREVAVMSVWNPKANALFLQAIEMSSPDQRVPFLDEACVGDPALRAEVEQLLKAHEEAGNFLQRPLLGDQPQSPRRPRNRATILARRPPTQPKPPSSIRKVPRPATGAP
jgi:hypothetical protein